ISNNIPKVGFNPIGYRGLETGDRVIASHAIRQGSITFVFQSAINPVNGNEDNKTSEFGSHLLLHGDTPKDVAFSVSNCNAMYSKAIKQGAESVKSPCVEKDENGQVIMATISLSADVTYTFVERSNYGGDWLPGYQTMSIDCINHLL
ncbi:hypothetical protein HK096_009832, partial [Nowakowskiella sp. JEL0078]